ELRNSEENEALCLRYRQQWRQELKALFCAGGASFIDALMRSSHPNPALLLEQWGTVGHPWHPMHKTRLGLSPREVTAMSPEFQAVLRLPLAALRRDCAHLAAVDDGCDYRDWFAQHYPQAWRQWLAALERAGQGGARAENWLPLPLHPYQAQHLVPREFAAEIAAGELLLLADAGMHASPTMSFRTMVPDGSATAPHVKLPVSLRLTSVQRAVSPKIAVMGPRFTRLLEQVLRREGHFGGALDIIPEYLGLHHAGPASGDERARHLAVLYRGNPMDKRSAEHLPAPVGALFADSPADGRPIAAEVAMHCGQGRAGCELEYFRRHAATVLAGTLGAYLLYGMGFEAHQQNSFMLLDRHCRPARLLLRDFGDLRVHMPTLRAAGLDLEPHRAGHACFEDDAPVRDKLLHAVMLCHLGELGLLLARIAGQPEQDFWRVMREEVEAAFERLRPRTLPARWETERHALLEADWPVKSFLRMRLLGTSDDVHGTMRNPLLG
ncbi:MAG TPA: IucA/IucC family protein, partial [Acetobacteraceae bacterium]